MLTLSNLSIFNNDLEILKNISVTFFPGAIVNLYGPNGIGKSSLIRALATLSSYEGDLLFNEIDIKKALSEYRSLLDYIGHSNAITPQMNVYENMALWANLNDRFETIEAAAHTFGLTEFLDHKASDLSRGWQRKLFLSKLLLKDSHLWLIDEPFANLDNPSKELLHSVINTKASLGSIIVYTSHVKTNDPRTININLEDYA